MIRLVQSISIILFTTFSSAWAQTPDMIREAQSALAATGRDPGPIDGLWGRRTEAALIDFLEERGQVFDGVLSENEMSFLRSRSGFIETSNPEAFNFDARRTYLAVAPAFQSRACQAAGQMEIPLIRAVDGRTGSTDEMIEQMGELYVSGIRNATSCFVGDAGSCANVTDALTRYAQNDGLGYIGDSTPGAWPFDQARLEFAISMKPLVGAYYFAKLQGLVPEEDAQLIDPWLIETTNFYTRNSPDRFNNRETHAAVMSAVTGLATGNQDLINNSERYYSAVFDALRPDGSFPEDSARGSIAANVHGLHVTHLVNLAEYLAMANVDVFASEQAQESIHQAMTFWLDAMETWETVYPYAAENIGAPTSDYREQIIFRPNLVMGPIETYRQRYPEHANTARINALVLDTRTCTVPLHREGKSALLGLCSSPEDTVRLADLVNAATGLPDRGIVPSACMFGEALKTEPVFTAQEVYAEEKFAEDNFQRVELALLGNDVGGVPVRDLVFDVFLDYSTPDNSPSSIEFVRLFFPMVSLQDEQSRNADFGTCRDILVREQDGQVILGLALLGDLSENGCVLSKMGEQDQTQFKSLQQELGEILTLATGNGAATLRAAFGLPEPETQRLPSLLADRINVRQTSSEDRWNAYQMTLSNVRLAGSETPAGLRFDVLTDYSNAQKSPADMNFMRIWFPRRVLVDPESRQADYSSCRNIVFRESNGDQNLAVALLGDMSENSCILRKMGRNDRTLLTAVINDLGGLLGANATEGAAGHLAEALSFHSDR